MKRSEYCGRFGENFIKKQVTACGWVQNKRDMGGVIFIDLRDKTGILQVVVNAANVSQSEFEFAEKVRNESVIEVTGIIEMRDEETYNPKIPTGTVELMTTEFKVLSGAGNLPFAVEDGAPVRDDLRLKYRYLDLRRQSMQKNLYFRHLVQKLSESYLDERGFTSVETPMLTKSTPEGARDYLVPSRVHPGTFYALPQSPQIFKQILMVSGLDKYYQVARCFRDEDLRADRQPEFTQVDLEMSFIEQEDILQELEGMFKYILKHAVDMEFSEPFPRITWQEAMDVYGSDKPDTRFDLKIVDITELAGSCSFSVFNRVVKSGGVVRAINVKQTELTRTQIEGLTEKAQGYGAKGMAWIQYRPDGEIYSILTKYMKQEEFTELFALMDAVPGDFILFCADTLKTVRRTLGGLRNDVADMLDLRCPEHKLLFVTDFPEFEYSEEENRFIATHHPFTMPYPEDIEYLFSDPGRVRAQAYDVVMNGVELGSGSIRIHDSEVQNTMFKALGFSEEETLEKFGFLIEAFSYGTPPHGGFAFGLDRLVMLLVGATSLREVIAFPKTKEASCLLTDAPSPVGEEQLEILKLFKPIEERTQTVQSEAQFDVDKIAMLSKLYISDSEKPEIMKNMADIVKFADELAKVDTQGIEPTAHIIPTVNVLREDVELPSFPREELLKNAPRVSEDMVFVPKTF